MMDSVKFKPHDLMMKYFTFIKIVSSVGDFGVSHHPIMQYEPI